METSSLNYMFTRDYCKEWGPIEALREIVQNTIDATSAGIFSVEDNIVTVSTPGEVLEAKHFALGYSDKRKGSVGGFGEGFKIAMLILTREGLNPVIQTGELTITGEFKPTAVGETFHLNLIQDEDHYCSAVVFRCELGDVNLTELKLKLPVFSETPLPNPRDIDLVHLTDVTQGGHVYVNGLFICNKSSLVYSYNFHPDLIVVNRDRNMTGDLAWELGKYIAKGNVMTAKQAFKLVEQDAYDVSNLSYPIDSTSTFAKALVAEFYDLYGNGSKFGVVGRSYGYHSGATVSTSQGRVFAACGIEEAVRTIDPKSPCGLLTHFATKHRKVLRRNVRKDLAALTTAAKAWSK